MIKKNIGTGDRLIRLGIAVALFALAAWWKSWVILGFAFFTLFEAVASWCIFYQVIGKSSCKVDRGIKK